MAWGGGCGLERWVTFLINAHHMCDQTKHPRWAVLEEQCLLGYGNVTTYNG